MYKRLSEEKVTAILEAGIEEFAKHGLDRANTNLIAKKAEVSVGVLYKYFGDKDSFFLACVRHSLKLLHRVYDEIGKQNLPFEEQIRRLIRALLKNNREFSNYNVMYNEITSGSCSKYAGLLATEIESLSAGIYTRIIENGRNKGLIRKDIDPKFFAFFFDNLLMSLQFAGSCEYYKNRFYIFCGEDMNNEEMIIEQFVHFVKGAFGIEKEETV